ncbi:MAG: phosphohistidine phosphatase SixA [Pseudanabaena sp. ELA607]
MSYSLYLIRHGIAAERDSYDDDTLRPLTPEGATKTRAVAQRLYQLGLRFGHFQVSPLVRAQQTAAIFNDVFSHDGSGAAAAKSSLICETRSELAPEGNFDAWLTWFTQWHAQHIAADHKPPSLGLIGHEPDLTSWAEALLWGEIRGVLALKKAGIIGLTLPTTPPYIGQGILFLLTPPKLII